MGDDTGFLIHVSVGSVLLDHLVVDPQQEERGGPLSDEQGMMAFAGGFEDERARDCSQGRAKEKTGGQLGGVTAREPADSSSRFWGSSFFCKIR